MSEKRKKRIYSFVAIAAVFALLQFYAPEIEKALRFNDENTQVKTDSIPVYQPKYYYGIIIDSLQVYEGTIRNNQSLAEILADYQVSNETLFLLAQNSKDVFDVRKLVSRKPYSILYKGDSIQKKATHFIYIPNSVDYVVFELMDSLKVYKVKKPIQVIEKELSGDIATSLYVDMMNNGGHVDLVNNLAEIFSWQVDFFGIQKGDAYKIIFDEHLVDNKVVGVGEIKAAYFSHVGEEFYGIQFDQGEGSDYYSTKGESLRRAFLKAPLSFTRISSRYTGRRFHPVLKTFKAHLGTDYAAPRGTPIFAAADGSVVEAQYKSNNGNYVKIQHNGNLATQYLHMSKIANGVRRGKKVKRGETIGFVGSTGLASGPHLCYRFWQNGVQVDALKVKLPSSDPIKEENKVEFDSIQQVMVKRLDAIQLTTQPDILARQQ